MSGTASNLPQFVTPRHVSQALRMPWADVREALEERGVKLLKLGKRIRVPRAALDDLIADSTLLDRGEQRDRADEIRIESVRARRGDEAAEAFAARIARRRGVAGMVEALRQRTLIPRDCGGPGEVRP